MTRERALEVLTRGAQYANYSAYMMKDEIEYVMAGWNRMPSNICFYDALLPVARQQAPFWEPGQAHDLPIYNH